jgi:hypothetical protein
MDHPSRLQFDDAKGKERAKEEIGHLHEVTRPDLRRVVVQERRPVLPSWLWWTNGSHVSLNGALAHVDTELQEFPTDTLSPEDGDCSPPFP